MPEFRTRRESIFRIESLQNKLSEGAIEKKLEDLDVNKACGVDEISTFVLKACASSFAAPLSVLFARSLSEGRLGRPANGRRPM